MIGPTLNPRSLGRGRFARIVSSLAIAIATTMCLASTAGAFGFGFGWDDATGDLDMPWLGNGERARMFTKKSTCMMCPTGYTFHQSWGTSGGSGQEPYGTVARALRFLEDRGVLGKWPEAIGEGSVSDGREIIEPRAVPYRFMVVAIEPTIVVMRFDLGALVKEGAFDEDQSIGSPRLNVPVEYGTRMPATGTLMWFSPDVEQTPTPVTMASPDRGEIVAKNKRYVLERRADEWLIQKPVAAR